MRVLIAFDASEASSRAAQDAARLFEGAEFLVISVTPRPAPWVTGVPAAGVGAPVVDVPEQDQFADELRLIERAHAAGIPVAEAIATQGDPVTRICETANERDVDVIVVGSHDKSALRRLIDPSVADAVVHGSAKPVLVVSGTR